MKKTLYIVVICFFLAFDLTAQKLVEDKIDEFTKSVIKKTEWCAFTKKNGSARPYRSEFRISKINNEVIFELKMMLNDKVYSIKEGDEIMFLMADKSVVTIKNLKYVITTQGEGAVGYGGSANLGTHTMYLIDTEAIKQLKEGQITKIRINTSIGYVEQEEKYNVDIHIKKCLELVNN